MKRTMRPSDAAWTRWAPLCLASLREQDGMRLRPLARAIGSSSEAGGTVKLALLHLVQAGLVYREGVPLGNDIRWFLTPAGREVELWG